MGEESANPPAKDLFRSFPSLPTSAAEVRQFVRGACSSALSSSDLDAAVLNVTELAANAMIHTDTPSFEVEISIREGVIRIGVRDDDLSSPEPTAPDREDTTGRGLQIVDRMSANWGVDYSEKRGKCVWFSMQSVPPFGSAP